MVKCNSWIFKKIQPAKNGVQGVEGSNPFIPTRNCKDFVGIRNPFFMPSDGF
jgi:hypothetical protein